MAYAGGASSAQHPFADRIGLPAALKRLIPERRWKRWVLGSVALLVLLAYVVAHFLDEPLRRRVEAGINDSLTGYKVSIRKLDFHPFGFSLDLEDSVIIQEAHPKPPMANVPVLTASVQWRELLRLRLVADFKIERPVIHFDQAQGEKELKDKTPVQDRGWQQAAEQIYPLKINLVRVVDGEIHYKPDGDFKPLDLTRVNIRTGNIRNIRSKGSEYPSDIHIDAVVFENGTLRVDGNADFLREPFAGVRTEVEIDKLPLSYLTSVLHDYATIRKGSLSGKGEIEYAPKIQRVELADVALSGVDGDYQLTNANYQKSEEMRLDTIKEAKKVSNAPDVILRAKKIRITDSTLGWIDRTASPDYRLFLSGLDASLIDFSNQTKDGPSTLDAKGRFNSSGPATLHAVFRPQSKSPDFDLAVKISDTDLTTMNNLLRSKGNIDVTAGFLSFFSELKVHNDAIDGYVKVLFHDVDVYDKAQDKHKPIMNKVKEFVADGLADLLQNRGTEEVATRARVSGPLENPNTSVWEIIGKLVQNAFFKAILPGLDTSGDADTNVAAGITSEPAKTEDGKKDGSKDDDDKGRLRRWIDKHRSKDKD